MRISLFLSIVFFIVVSACNNQKEENNSNPKKKKLEMYQKSELSELMRKMQKELETLKAEIDQKEVEEIDLSTYLLDYQDILTAQPTDNKTKDVTFLGFASFYLEKTKELKNSRPENLIFNYNNTVAACISCHEKHCSGPIKMINGLKIL
jgi:thioredoxin reductase